MKWYHDEKILTVIMAGASTAIVLSMITPTTALFPDQFDPGPRDFRNFGNPQEYCPAAKPGSVTLGYAKPNPWTDQVFCLGGENLWEISATNTGIVTERIIPETQSAQGIYWTRSAMSGQSVVLSDDLAVICPDGNKPVAVLPYADGMEVYPTGATIRNGTVLCMVEGDLVQYETSLDSTSGRPQRWPNFTPTL